MKSVACSHINPPPKFKNLKNFIVPQLALLPERQEKNFFWCFSVARELWGGLAGPRHPRDDNGEPIPKRLGLTGLKNWRREENMAFILSSQMYLCCLGCA